MYALNTRLSCKIVENAVFKQCHFLISENQLSFLYTSVNYYPSFATNLINVSIAITSALYIHAYSPGGSLHHPPPKGLMKKAWFIRVAVSVPGTPECFLNRGSLDW